MDNIETSIENNALITWLQSLYQGQQFSLTSLVGDAGFRRYYRLVLTSENHGQSRFIVVDAPPEKSNNQAFVNIANTLLKHHVLVPEILHYQPSAGFFVLTDLGSTHLSDVLLLEKAQSQALNKAAVCLYYQRAIDNLIKIANITQLDDHPLPEYDADFVELELSIFTEWLLHKHLAITLTADEERQLAHCFKLLIANVLAQPQCFMHRDYHSRNLMLKDDEIAVIDFQDAVKGPITYDIVSLLRDCYIKWPQEIVIELFNYFKQQLMQQPNRQFGECCFDDNTWQRWFDLMGLQRHIKASGIFARLYHRDGKSGYLHDIPLTLSYIIDVAKHYPELSFLADVVANKVLPALTKKNESTEVIK